MTVTQCQQIVCVCERECVCEKERERKREREREIGLKSRRGRFLAKMKE